MLPMVAEFFFMWFPNVVFAILFMQRIHFLKSIFSGIGLGIELMVINPFAITTEHAQNIDDVRIFGDKHEEATVHFQ